MLLVWSSASGRLVEVNIAKEVLDMDFEFLFEAISSCVPLAISTSADPTSPQVFASLTVSILDAISTSTLPDIVLGKNQELTSTRRAELIDLMEKAATPQRLPEGDIGGAFYVKEISREEIRDEVREVTVITRQQRQRSFDRGIKPTFFSIGD